MRYLRLHGRAVLLAAACTALAPANAPAAESGARNLVLQAAAPDAAKSSQRLALVIGNSGYREAPLTNPANDARAMARALQDAGFTVLLHTDVDHRSLLAAVRDFGNRLRQGGVGIFYFAGHGMQIKGRNYLIPVGADIQREDEVAYGSLDAQAVLDKMEAAGNGANLMILDACRNNPFARSFRSSVQGLAQMEAPVGTMVAFATAPGAVASDGQGQNGLYTQHLLAAMRKPGAKVEDVFKQVRAAVRRDSQGRQIPWEATSLEGDLYFVAAPPPPSPAPPPPPPPSPVVASQVPVADTSLDDTFWQAVRDSREVTLIRGYLTRFPQGRHVEEAWRRLALLASPSSPGAVAPAATAPAPRPPSTAATTVVAASPISAPGLAAVGHSDPAEQANIDRVTADLLAEMQRKQGESRPVAPPNAGLSVGDRWNFQRIDRFRGEVTENFSWRVAGIDRQGLPYLDGDQDYQHPISVFARKLLMPSAFGTSPQADRSVWWGDLKRGQSLSVALKTPIRRSDNSTVPAELKAKLNHRGSERVRVPAGEFEAERLDIEGSVWFHEVNVPRTALFWSLRVWYVPELRGIAASEVEVRHSYGNRLDSTSRNELTSYELAGGSRLATAR